MFVNKRELSFSLINKQLEKRIRNIFTVVEVLEVELVVLVDAELVDGVYNYLGLAFGFIVRIT